jgi:hypothetical protein
MDMLVPVLQGEIHVGFLCDIITLATPREDHLVSAGKLPLLVSRFSYRKIVEIFVNHEVGYKLFVSKIEADRPARARDREKCHPGWSNLVFEQHRPVSVTPRITILSKRIRGS